MTRGGSGLYSIVLTARFSGVLDFRYAEKVLPHGPRISVAVALGLIALGLLVGSGAVQLGG
jgi:hypothetical protein